MNYDPRSKVFRFQDDRGYLQLLHPKHCDYVRIGPRPTARNYDKDENYKEVAPTLFMKKMEKSLATLMFPSSESEKPMSILSNQRFI